MSDSCIKDSIDKVKQYLAEKQGVDELLKQADKVKPIIMGSNYWNDRKKIIEQVLRCNVCINTENVKDKLADYKYSIQGGSVIADLCRAFQVNIPQDLQTKFGSELNCQSEEKKSSNFIGNCGEILSNLQQTLKEAISRTLKIDVNTKLSDDQIYQIVSRLPDYEGESKELLLKSLRKTNGAENPGAKLEQPPPNLFDLLGDENLKTHIDKYKEKPLGERKKDPLRQVFRWNSNTRNNNLNQTTKDKTIQQWFTGLMSKTVSEHRNDIYFVLLELFGKDFEFGGYQYEDDGKTKTIPKFKLWDKVDKKAVKDWYKEKKIRTDLFDNLQIETEIVITEEQKNNNTNATAEKNKKKNGTEEKQPETSKTGYQIGLGLDILVTILFVYLGISNPLFFLALIITVPVGIFCGIKLSGCCSSFGDGKIEISGQYRQYLPAETIEPEPQPNQYDIIDNEYKDPNNKKPVKIITKYD